MRKKPTQRKTDEELYAESVRLFPDWTDATRERWIQAKRAVERHVPVPIGDKGLDREPPDFLRALPREQQLEVDKSAGDYVRGAMRMLTGGRR